MTIGRYAAVGCDHENFVGRMTVYSQAQEETLSNDVAAMERKLLCAARTRQPVHPTGGQSNALRRLSHAAQDGGGSLVPEAKAHDDFLAKHGPCGGWHPDDAATFAQAFRQATLSWHMSVPITSIQERL